MFASNGAIEEIRKLEGIASILELRLKKLALMGEFGARHYLLAKYLEQAYYNAAHAHTFLAKSAESIKDVDTTA